MYTLGTILPEPNRAANAANDRAIIDACLAEVAYFDRSTIIESNIRLLGTKLAACNDMRAALAKVTDAICARDFKIWLRPDVRWFLREGVAEAEEVVRRVNSESQLPAADR